MHFPACCTKGIVLFTSGPQNQTIMEGESVHFECAYEGSDLTPSWRINASIYSHTELPRSYEFNDQDFSLTIHNVPVSLNFTSFQCVVGTSFSSRGYLIVDVHQENITEGCVECIMPTSNSPLRDTLNKETTGVLLVLHARQTN